MRKVKWITVALGLVVLFVFWQFVRTHFREEERMLRTQIRESIQEAFPESYLRSRLSYGLLPYKRDGEKRGNISGKGAVILVHGLDDPGIIWQTFAPILVDQGYQVQILTYPNDQPIKDSALFFAEELQTFLANGGVSQVSVVCHSMGGLVTREMMTNPQIGYQSMQKNGQIPRVTQLIMVGTPNHGSSLSLFRIFTEIRDQIVSAKKDDYLWLQPIFDGLGEAGIELLPHSVFLQELNSRPLPEGVKMLTIAGVMSPLEKNAMEKGFSALQKSLPASAESTVLRLRPVLKKMQSEVGDGLVSVESVKLPGVVFRHVQGNHATILRNLDETSDRIPPAIPIILDELENH